MSSQVDELLAAGSGPISRSPLAVALACPSCGSRLAEGSACGCPAATRLELWHGVPRLLFDQESLGDGARKKLTTILDRMAEVHWKKALAEIVPDDPLWQRLVRGVRGDFVHSMPWDEIDSVLEIGAGLGSLTSLLAERAGNVVAVEAAPEQALFQRIRALQDGFPNWHPVVAKETDLPFAPETFDLVAINGCFPEIGRGGQGDPHEMQQRFLARILRLLRPNGYLYVAAETHCGPRSIHGFRDLPRLAFGRGPGGSTKRTPSQYARLVEKAGFGKVEIFGVHGGFDHQIAVYRLGETRPRQATLSIVDPPATWKRKLFRQVMNSGPWREAFECDVVVFARKKRETGRLSWVGLPCAGPVTQFSTANKVFALCFTNDRPTSVCVAAKTAHARERLPREYDFLAAASQRHGPDWQHWLLRWPKTLGKLSVQGQEIYHYEYADGTPLNRLLLPVSFDASRFLRLFAGLMSEYVDLCRRLTAALPGRLSQSAAERSLLSRLANVKCTDESLSRRIRAACSRFEQKPRALHVTHGDLSLCNTVALADDALVLIDWENVDLAGLIEIDLLRLLYDTWDESARLQPKIRQALMERAKEATRESLSRLGIAPDRHGDVEALFMAHQLELGAVRDGDPRALLKAYKERGFALD